MRNIITLALITLVTLAVLFGVLTSTEKGLITAGEVSTTQPVTQPVTTKKKPVKKLNGWKNSRYYVNGVYVVGKKKIGKKWYVFKKNGIVAKKTTTVNGVKYFLNSKRKLEAYKIKKNYYFPSGKKMKSYQKNDYITLQRARKIVKKITNNKMTKEQKRWKCFMWVSKDPYITHRHFVPKKGWPALYANDHFLRHSGDCHADGSAFAYLAKALGYKKCYAVLDSSGYTKKGHCWAEVNGRVFDPLFIERGTKRKDYNSPYEVFGLHPVRKFEVAKYY